MRDGFSGPYPVLQQKRPHPWRDSPCTSWVAGTGDRRHSKQAITKHQRIAAARADAPWSRLCKPWLAAWAHLFLAPASLTPPPLPSARSCTCYDFLAPKGTCTRHGSSSPQGIQSGTLGTRRKWPGSYFTVLHPSFLLSFALDSLPTISIIHSLRYPSGLPPHIFT